MEMTRADWYRMTRKYIKHLGFVQVVRGFGWQAKRLPWVRVLLYEDELVVWRKSSGVWVRCTITFNEMNEGDLRKAFLLSA